MSAEIGRRVASLLPEGRTQREIALEVGMTPDAFSRALNGQRGFAAVELARLADLLDADLHLLITGEPDPNRVVAAARHTYDHDTKRHHLPGVDQDRPQLESVLLAYEQVHGALAPSAIPSSLAEARTALGEDFVLPFADRLDAIGIDVVRIRDLTSAYSLFIGQRAVIVLKATGNWFWENWSLAHELAHVVERANAIRHGDAREHMPDERAANAFAAELLLPAARIETVDWATNSEADLANRVWDLGVSTEALSTRLASLGLPAAPHIAAWAAQPTQRLLRRHLVTLGDDDPITRRMDAASTRRFPLALQDAHLREIARGTVRKDTLAWMLGVQAEALEVDEPASRNITSAGELAAILDL
ncbi:MAG: ImmA/IrrE family metallo-endopeptidase [Leifsonia sp.]